METYDKRQKTDLFFLVVSLPMRDGNLFQAFFFRIVLKVVSLPMRDGNYNADDWRIGIPEVVSLPMRDGNRLFHLLMPLLSRLLAYL